MQRRESLTFVVGGGGLTGIEMVGELAEWVVALSSKYNIPRDQINLIVVEALADILPTLRPSLVEKSKRILRSKGVTLMVNSPITRVSPTEVELDSGENIMTRTLIWTSGVRANHLIAGLGLRTGGCNWRLYMVHHR